MSVKYRILISLFFALLILIPVFFYLKDLTPNTLKQNSLQSSILPTPTPALTENEFLDSKNFNIPNNFMGFSVISVERADSSIEENAFYFDFRSFPLPLRGWKAKKEGLSNEDYTKYQKLFRDYLDSEFTKRGWAADIDVNGKTLQPLIADGPGGSVWGYVKRVGDKFQVIILQEINSSYKNRPIYSLKDDCPCNLSFYVFFSDVLNMDIIIKQ